ncbi:glycosyltransferase [Planctomycetes bacterium K23_9]|uniref:D-inositol-3-phosphate glycosyltransferase n=1 Tax=Stieleria marina TaxID=1930275 RepID=A0A517NLW3_9BACT|nr:D-inositol-3-phosphate glycosyltransferase [Planctomycetes bacterium K23_9]
MHVLFAHKNYPAQFGHIARYLIDHHDFRCTFISEKPPGKHAGLERLQYKCSGGATEKTHVCSRSFENQIWHSHAVYETLKARPDIQPDLVVGHSGFLSTLYLRELYDCPIINYFEFFYHTQDSDLDFRKDLPAYGMSDLLRARTRNAIFLLDLQNCDRGYSPTEFQRSQLPAEYSEKVVSIFDGIDTNLWKPVEDPNRLIGSWQLPTDKKIITYVSRGMEAMRGFDVFMKIAKRLCDTRDDVLFVVVGEDRVAYGGDLRFTQGTTFKQWVLAQDDYDLERILFLGRIHPQQLVQLFSISDLHFYLTAPFVLSWSMMNALACGATVIGSDTAPVREMITHGDNGLLFDFFDVDAAAEMANEVLDNLGDYQALGKSAEDFVAQSYSLDVCLPRMMDLYRSTGA